MNDLQLFIQYCYLIEWKRTLPHGPWFLVRTQRRIGSLTHGKNKFIKERTEHLKGEMGQARRGTGAQETRYGFFLRLDFYILI